MKSESEVQQEIQMFAASLGCNLMRNNSGAGMLRAEDGRESYVRFGLGNISKEHNEEIKSSDLVGTLPMMMVYDDRNIFMRFDFVTPKVLLNRPSNWPLVGRAIYIEVKKEGWRFNPKDKREQAQLAFINLERARGAIAGFCASVEDFKRLIYYPIQS